MTSKKYSFDYTYDIQEYGNIELDLDAALDLQEAEELAIVEIKDLYPDVKNITITTIESK